MASTKVRADTIADVGSSGEAGVRGRGALARLLLVVVRAGCLTLIDVRCNRLPAYPWKSSGEAVCSLHALCLGGYGHGVQDSSRMHDLSDSRFRAAFGTEEQCGAALLRLRWPDDFACPRCGHRGH